MKKISYILILSLMSALCLCSCEEESIGQYPIDEVPPGPVTDVVVSETFGGGAVLSFQIPDDPDLMGVIANFTLDTGKETEVMVSSYARQLTVKGFAEAKEHPVSIRTMDKSRNLSDPVVVMVTPNRAPIYDVYETLAMYDDFGGMQIQWENPERQDIIISVSRPITEGSDMLEDVTTFYSSEKDGMANVRGFTEPQMFYVSVSDPYGNQTEMVSKLVSPMYEEEIQGSKYWKKWNPSDIPYKQYSKNYPIEKLWDGITMEVSTSSNFFHTPAGGTFPVRFTFDMQQVYQLSRMKMYHRGQQWVYKHGNPKVFSVYGSLSSNVKLDATDPENQWIFLGRFYSVKPSGLPVGEYTNEDLAKGGGGEEFNFPLHYSTPVRYIRFDVEETWGGTEMIHISELRMWGQPDNSQ